MTSVPVPPPRPPTVRPFVRADLAATVATLARAFDDDPVMTWIFPDDAMRRRRLPGFFGAALRSSNARRDGTEGIEVAVRGRQVLGAAIWLAPGEWRPPLWRQLAGVSYLWWALATLVAAGATISVAAATAAAPRRSAAPAPVSAVS